MGIGKILYVTYYSSVKLLYLTQVTTLIRYQITVIHISSKTQNNNTKINTVVKQELEIK